MKSKMHKTKRDQLEALIQSYVDEISGSFHFL